MVEYDGLKNELIAISDILKKYPEAVQAQVFEILVSNYLGYAKGQKKKDRGVASRPQSVSTKSQKKPTTNKKAKSKSYELIDDIDLKGKGNTPAFDKFYSDKKPKNAIQFNTLAVYYLSHYLKVSKISIDHIYTCYRKVKRPYGSLKDSIWNATRTNTSYLKASDMSDIKITSIGRDLIENELPKVVK